MGVNKDSYLILDTLPSEYDSRVKVCILPVYKSVIDGYPLIVLCLKASFMLTQQFQLVLRIRVRDPVRFDTGPGSGIVLFRVPDPYL